MLKRLFPPAKPARFGKLMIRALRGTGYSEPLRFDLDGFRIIGGDKDDFLCNLENIYAEYCRAPFLKRPLVVQDFVTAIATGNSDSPISYEDAKGLLWPHIHHRMRYEAMKLMALEHGMTDKMDPNYHVVADSLALSIAVNSEHSLQTLGTQQLNDWGINHEQAMEVAKENMWLGSNESFHEMTPGVWLSPWQDNLDASRMALPDLIWQLKVKGRHVAIPATRDALIVTGEDDAEGFQLAASLAIKAIESGRQVSLMPYVLDGRDWRQFVPDPAHPNHATARAMRIREMELVYNDQTDLLYKVHEKTGEEVYVAQFAAFEDKDTTEPFSACTWGENIASLLPVTDRIMFARRDASGDAEVQLVAWDVAEREFGELMQPTDLWPPRYRVGTFPPLERIKAIRIDA